MTAFCLLAAAHPLVHLNAALNTAATLLLLVGYGLIRQGRPVAHARVMLTAFAVSCAFLVSYLTYHFAVQLHVSFTHPGAVRYVYLAILLSHIVLAAAVPFLAIITIVLGLKATGYLGRTDVPSEERHRLLGRHRRWARWTYPIWLYVSVTGVVVYAMLYHLWPSAEI